MIETLLVKDAINVAKNYPSGGNCSPFDFCFNEQKQTLAVNYIAKNSEHCLVYEPHLVIMTLGFALEYVRCAFANREVTTSFEFDFADFSVFEDKHALCTVNLGGAAQFDRTVFSDDVLKQRVTDRRRYQKLKGEDIQLLEDALPKKIGQLKTNIDNQVLKFFTACDAQIWKSKPLGIDTFREITFDKNASVGMEFQNLQLPAFQALPIRLIKFNSAFYDVIKLGGAEVMMKLSQSQLWRSNSTAIVFQHPVDESLPNQVFHFMECMHSILKLSELGFNYHPSTLSTLLLNYPLDNRPLNLENSKAKLPLKQLKEKIESMRNKLELGDSSVGWVIRVGKPYSPFKKEQMTARKPIDEIFRSDS